MNLFNFLFGLTVGVLVGHYSWNEAVSLFKKIKGLVSKK